MHAAWSGSAEVFRAVVVAIEDHLGRDQVRCTVDALLIAACLSLIFFFFAVLAVPAAHVTVVLAVAVSAVAASIVDVSPRVLPRRSLSRAKQLTRTKKRTSWIRVKQTQRVGDKK